MTIHQECVNRNIDRLFHFTRAENVPGILANGLLPPSHIRRRALPSTSNDPYRHDGLDATCLTIEWPNYKMFYPLRCEAPQGTNWAVLQIDHAVLWEKRCCFSVTNAADGSVSGIPVAQRSGLAAFQALFQDYGGKTRVGLGIPENFPTNPQAEISCFDPIGPAYIAAVWLNDAGAAHALQGLHDNVHNNIRYHWPRFDHNHW